MKNGKHETQEQLTLRILSAAAKASIEEPFIPSCLKDAQCAKMLIDSGHATGRVGTPGDGTWYGMVIGITTEGSQMLAELTEKEQASRPSSKAKAFASRSLERSLIFISGLASMKLFDMIWDWLFCK